MLGTPLLCVSSGYNYSNEVLGGQNEIKSGGIDQMAQITESARRELRQSVAKQISLYLLSFWFTWMFSLIHSVY
jgi:hypothetical protein